MDSVEVVGNIGLFVIFVLAITPFFFAKRWFKYLEQFKKDASEIDTTISGYIPPPRNIIWGGDDNYRLGFSGLDYEHNERGK